MHKALCYISVLLHAPDTVLLERATGKRVDPETGGSFSFVNAN